MDRKMFETEMAKKREELVNEDHGEALEMDKERDEILADVALKKEKLAEIEGKPSESKAQEQKEIFKTWRTVELGTGLKTAKEFEKALKDAGCYIGDYAKELLKEAEKEIKNSPSSEKREIELVDATPAELGLPEGGTLEEIYAAAEKKGLEKCPKEAGPQSRLQYPEQPKGEYRLIGMDPVAGLGGYRYVFSVSRDGDGRRWLHAGYDGPGRVWDPDYHFVFVRRKKSETEK